MSKWILRAIIRVPVRKNVYRLVEYREPVEAATRKEARLLAPQKFPDINLNSAKVKLIVSKG